MLRILEKIDDVSREEWESVLARSFRPSLFLSPRFLVPWANAFAGDMPLRLVRWEKKGNAEGFLFLCGRPDGQGWEFLGGEDVADSLDAVAPAGEEGEFWREFLGGAREILSGGPLRLQSLVEGSPSISLLPEICGELGIGFLLEETDRSPFIPLPGSFEAYVESLGKKERHELRRKLRRAADSDPSLSYRVTGTKEDLERDFPSFAALHRKSHPEKRRFMDARMERFFRALAEEFLAAGGLRLAFLSGSKGDLATAFQVEFDGALFLYNSGFDPAAAAGTSPGLALITRCIEDAIGRGLAEYDFLRGRERYKYELGGRDRIVYRAVLDLA